MIAQLFVYLFFAYLGIGLLIGLWFIFKGLEKLDTGLKGASWKVRLLLLPASIGLWPLLLYKFFKTSSA